MPSVCLIGAGMTGLVAAHALLERGFRVTLVESAAEPGGMVRGLTLGRRRIEALYHHIFTSDQAARTLIEQLKLTDRLQWLDTQDGLLCGGQLYPFASPLDLLRFAPVPLSQRLKTGLTVLKAGRIRDWRPLEHQTALDWLKRHTGDEATARLWQPLLESKFGEDAAQVSAVWIWNKFKLRGGSRQDKLNQQSLGYLDGSFALLAERLAAAISEKGGQILYDRTAFRIRQLTDSPQQAGRPRYAVDLANSRAKAESLQADAVISTVAAPLMRRLISNLSWPQAYLQQLEQLRYKANICLLLQLTEPVLPYYWTTVCDPLPFVVAVEQTNLITDPQGYGGHVLYLSRYLDVTDPLWQQPDRKIFELFCANLPQLNPNFDPKKILSWRLFRTRYAQPVIMQQYSARMPALQTPDPGILLAGMAQIYPEDRGINYAIRLGLEAAARAGDYLSS